MEGDDVGIHAGISQEVQDVVDGCTQTFEAARHFFQPFIAEVQGAAVVVGNEEEAQGIGAVVFQDVLDQEEVVQGLAHLFRIDGDEAVVEPVFDHGFLAGEGFGLGDFVFMVRDKGIEERGRLVNIPDWVYEDMF